MLNRLSILKSKICKESNKTEKQMSKIGCSNKGFLSSSNRRKLARLKLRMQDDGQRPRKPRMTSV